MKKSFSDTFQKQISVFDFAMKNNLLALKRASLDGDVLECTDHNDRSLLHIAAMKGHLSIVKYLIQIGANPNQKDIHGDTPLILAIKHNQHEVVQWLGYIRTLNKKITFPAHNAAMDGNLFLLQYYLQKRDPDELDEEQNTPLHHAVAQNHLPVVRYLVMQKRADVNKKNIYHVTPLEEAVHKGFHDIATFLRQHDAYFHIKSDSEQVVVGERSDFFEKLSILQHVLWFYFPECHLFQFFHTTYNGNDLFCCSKYVSHNAIASELYKTTSKLILDLSNDFFQNDFHVLHDADSLPQKQFLFSPYCRQFSVRSIATIPLIYKKRTLGYFVLWSGKDIRAQNPLDLKMFENILNSRYEDCLSISGSAFDYCTHHFSLIRNQLQTQIQESYKRDSYHFSDANLWIIRVLQNLQNDWAHLYGNEWFQKMVQVVVYQAMMNIPMHPSIALYHANSIMLQDLLRKKIVSVDSQHLYHINHPSPVFRELIRFCECFPVSCNPAPVPLKNTKPFTSLEMFEMIGNHPYPKNLLHEMNHLMASEIPIDQKFIEKIAQYILEAPSFRTANVIGIGGGNQYCLFCHFSEVMDASRYIFENMSSLDLSASLYFFYTGFVEYVHPFIDGNGRVFRLCVNIMLRRLGINSLLTKKIMSFEEFCQDHFNK